MAKILSIETSTALCSVALAVDGKVVSSRRSETVVNADGSTGMQRAHASMTAVFCDEVLREAGIRASALDAVCISDGPGSYTGLRVGLSTAKGLCFGTGAKLLSVSSLDVLASMGAEAISGGRDALARLGAVYGSGAPVSAASVSAASVSAASVSAASVSVASASATLASGTPASAASASGAPVSAADMGGVAAPSVIIPMIDARRMEVFCAEYSASGERKSEIRAEVVEAGSFGPMAEQCLFIGDGALKCRETIACGSAIFIGCCPDAASMAQLAEKQYQEGNWRDVAYFEPFYLKDYVPTKSTKSLF